MHCGEWLLNGAKLEEFHRKFTENINPYAICLNFNLTAYMTGDFRNLLTAKVSYGNEMFEIPVKFQTSVLLDLYVSNISAVMSTLFHHKWDI